MCEWGQRMLHGWSEGEKCNKQSQTWPRAELIPPSAERTSKSERQMMAVSHNIYLPNPKELNKEIVGKAGEEHLANDVDV